jgi:surface-anchored protein
MPGPDAVALLGCFDGPPRSYANHMSTPVDNDTTKPTMKTPILLITSFLALTSAPRLSAQCHSFTQEHLDLSLIWNPAGNELGLMASDDTHGGLYASNQCVVICPESMRFTLPAGTPLGTEGDPLWILPQNPYEGVPYVGVSAETIPAGTFNDPMAIQLTRVEGPGHFLVWQSVGFGQFDLKMDTRDGIGADDKLTPFVGGHEHHNWGFTTSGIYRAYFQVSGRRPGETTNILSLEIPFTFHVLPLKPFEIWQSTNWPCECCSNIIAAAADPDADQGVNAIEYALGTNPKVMTTDGWPTAGLVTTNGQTYGSLTYTRVKAATDVVYEVVGSSRLSLASWPVLSTIHSVVNRGDLERVTVRDDVPLKGSTNRFYQLRIRLP